MSFGDWGDMGDWDWGELGETSGAAAGGEFGDWGDWYGGAFGGASGGSGADGGYDASTGLMGFAGLSDADLMAMGFSGAQIAGPAALNSDVNQGTGMADWSGLEEAGIDAAELGEDAASGSGPGINWGSVATNAGKGLVMGPAGALIAGGVTLGREMANPSGAFDSTSMGVDYSGPSAGGGLELGGEWGGGMEGGDANLLPGVALTPDIGGTSGATGTNTGTNTGTSGAGSGSFNYDNPDLWAWYKNMAEKNYQQANENIMGSTPQGGGLMDMLADNRNALAGNLTKGRYDIAKGALDFEQQKELAKLGGQFNLDIAQMGTDASRYQTDLWAQQQEQENEYNLWTDVGELFADWDW